MRTVRLTKESTKDILENLLKRSPNNYGKFEAAVADILANVKEKGDEALFSYTKEFDKAEVDRRHHPCNRSGNPGSLCRQWTLPYWKSSARLW